ncbi:MAG TPA: cytochrome b [Acetobacteraceae bacterium]|nr:cytochrome b [Acetobacteraceae bacterium]
MQLRLPERYAKPAIVLHWVIATLMALNLGIAWSFDLVAKSGSGSLKGMHKSIGILVLGLAITRLLWRLTHTPPPIPPYAEWERRSARAMHWLLYALMFCIPLTGWANDSAWKGAATHPLRLFYVVPWFRFGWLEHLAPATKEQWHTVLLQLHISLAYVLCAAFVVHVAGALKHQFLERKPELQRMWF